MEQRVFHLPGKCVTISVYFAVQQNCGVMTARRSWTSCLEVMTWDFATVGTLPCPLPSPCCGGSLQRAMPVMRKFESLLVFSLFINKQSLFLKAQQTVPLLSKMAPKATIYPVGNWCWKYIKLTSSIDVKLKSKTNWICKSNWCQNCTSIWHHNFDLSLMPYKCESYF